MPVWHMHESLDYLLYLCEGFEYVGIGSSGKYAKLNSPEWHARIGEAFAAIDAWEASSNGAYIRPRLHMMKAQAQAHLYPFDSSDSTNVAMNHGRYRAEGEGHVARLAARASAKIEASSGPEAEHQLKRPLLGHVETAAMRASWEALWAADIEATAADGSVRLIEIKSNNGESKMEHEHDFMSAAGHDADWHDAITECDEVARSMLVTFGSFSEALRYARLQMPEESETVLSNVAEALVRQ
jgi:hypothetical protein